MNCGHCDRCFRKAARRAAARTVRRYPPEDRGATAGPGREAETEGGGENRSDHRAQENARADEREARHSARNALARPCRGGEVVKPPLPSDRVAARDHGLGPLRPSRRPRRRSRCQMRFRGGRRSCGVSRFGLVNGYPITGRLCAD